MQLLKLEATMVSLSASQLKPRFFSSSSSSSSSSCGVKVWPWRGLDEWRESHLNENRKWGENGPEPQPLFRDSTQLGQASSLAELGSIVLSTSDPLAKSQLSHMAYSMWRRHNLPLGISIPPSLPARPPNPQLVSPKEIPSPKDSGLPLNAYMLHNLAHVELNAIDLAWDTVVRFSPYSEILGERFFADFAHVADDESRHFSWCAQRLAELGFKYGDMPAHNILWRECEKSSGNVAARLAVIPLVQEARGLDAGPRLVKKLVGFGDNRTSKIVARIADEEIAHVAVGVYWFASVCQKMNCAPDSTFKGCEAWLIFTNLLRYDHTEGMQSSTLILFFCNDTDLLKEYNVELKGPFNYSARDEAGIPRDWYDDASSMSNQDKKDKDGNKKQLSAVYERLSSIIAMEKENSSLTKPPE